MRSRMVFLVTLMVVTLGMGSVSFSAAAEKDIVDTAVAGGFNTLVTAVKAADLVDTLKGKGPFTVFAPTDAAFAKLPPATLQDLLKPENKAKLQGILTYHVVAGYRSKDGKKENVFDALEWLAAMCSHVPNKGEQMVRYYGYYSNVSLEWLKMAPMQIEGKGQDERALNQVSQYV
jgi:uncharacterized surface protein with fasciclin (FAS1) repeats